MGRFVVMRCMSKNELIAFRRGDVLRNLSTHQGQRTDAIGFCFFPVGPESDKITERLRYLAGIVNLEVVAVFEAINGARLTPAWGHYASPETYNMDLLEIFIAKTVKRREFCTTVYDRNMLRLLAVGTPYRDRSSNEWVVCWHKGGKVVERLEGGEW